MMRRKWSNRFQAARGLIHLTMPQSVLRPLGEPVTMEKSLNMPGHSLYSNQGWFYLKAGKLKEKQNRDKFSIQNTKSIFVE